MVYRLDVCVTRMLPSVSLPFNMVMIDKAQFTISNMPFLCFIPTKALCSEGPSLPITNAPKVNSLKQHSCYTSIFVGQGLAGAQLATLLLHLLWTGVTRR